MVRGRMICLLQRDPNGRRTSRGRATAAVDGYRPSKVVPDTIGASSLSETNDAWFQRWPTAATNTKRAQ